VLRGAWWLLRAGRHLFNLPGVHVLDVAWLGQRRKLPPGLTLVVETDPAVTGCLGCGVVAESRGRRVRACTTCRRSGRSGKAYADWLRFRGSAFTAGIGTATLDPFRGYGNAVRDELDDATAVLDAFHVVRLGLKAMEETRRRVQQQQLGHRGIKHDPLYRIRNPLRAGAERLSARQIERIEAGLQAGDPTFEVTVAWRCYQQLRSAFGASSLLEGRAIAVKVLDSFPTGPIPEIARLGRTLNAWKQQFLAYFTTQRANNGGTEAINGIIELHRRIARGSTNPANYRLRMILAAGKLTPPESPMSRITPQVVGTSRRARGVRNAMCRPERQSTFQLIDCVLWIGY
jgi:hypothetical protein